MSQKTEGLVCTLGTTEYRLNPGHRLEKETEKGSQMKRSYRKRGDM